MPLIKRYANRKLYNTETKQYITLEGIADLIRRGQDVQVVDNATGEDLTALTLSQIIFEQEKKQGGFLPRSVLTGLVQAGGDTITNLRHSLAGSLGLMRQIDFEIERRIKTLIKQGDITEEEGQHLLNKLLALELQTSASNWISEEDIEQAIAKRGIPSRNELQEISDQLETLMAKLGDLDQDQGQ
jgi:polyhydroxyalkanoate synthesis repressor PhaR